VARAFEHSRADDFRRVLDDCAMCTHSPGTPEMQFFSEGDELVEQRLAMTVRRVPYQSA
jgi:hypothetical protein